MPPRRLTCPILNRNSAIAKIAHYYETMSGPNDATAVDQIRHEMKLFTNAIEDGNGMTAARTVPGFNQFSRALAEHLKTIGGEV